MARKLTLKEIDAQIAHLQQQAAQLRDAEKAGVIERMREAIAYYDITAAELGLDGSAGLRASTKAAVPKAEKPRPKGRIKYRDDAGNTWSGYGPRPKWIVAAIASGKAEADLRA